MSHLHTADPYAQLHPACNGGLPHHERIIDSVGFCILLMIRGQCNSIPAAGLLTSVECCAPGTQAAKYLLSLAGFIEDKEEQQLTGVPEYYVALRTQLLHGATSYAIQEQAEYAEAIRRDAGEGEVLVQVGTGSNSCRMGKFCNQGKRQVGAGRPEGASMNLWGSRALHTWPG